MVTIRHLISLFLSKKSCFSYLNQYFLVLLISLIINTLQLFVFNYFQILLNKFAYINLNNLSLTHQTTTTNTNTNTNNMNYDKLKNALILETKQQVLNEQKKSTNGSRKSLFQRKNEQVFNNVANLIESNDFKLKRKLERQQKREFFKNKRMNAR